MIKAYAQELRRVKNKLISRRESLEEKLFSKDEMGGSNWKYSYDVEQRERFERVILKLDEAINSLSEAILKLEEIYKIVIITFKDGERDLFCSRKEGQRVKNYRRAITEGVWLLCPKCENEAACFNHELAGQKRDIECRACGIIGEAKDFKDPRPEGLSCQICKGGGCISCRPGWFL